MAYIYINLAENLGETLTYILRLFMSGFFLYAVPIIAGLIIFGLDNTRKMFKKPVRMAKALGNFPALYGFGQLTNLFTLLAVWIISQFRSQRLEEEVIERSFGTMNSLIPPNILCGIILFLHMVLAAGIFEEVIFRGIMLNALKPYGKGFAIISTGFLFGIAHGNFQQFFYCFVVGIILGYIAVQTGSILATVILHASFNAIAAIMMLFFSTKTIQDYLLEGSAAVEEASDQSMMILAMFGTYFAFFLILLIAGVALAIKKLTRVKSYLHNTEETADINIKTRWRVFFLSVPAVFMLVLTIDNFAGMYVLSEIIEMLLRR